MGVATFNGPFWFGTNMKEVIIVTDGQYALLDHNTQKGDYIGHSLFEAQERLKTLGKDENFADFMREK